MNIALHPVRMNVSGKEETATEFRSLCEPKMHPKYVSPCCFPSTIESAPAAMYASATTTLWLDVQLSQDP